MAIPWPQGADWPLEIREHATELTKCLRDTLNCIDRSQDQAVPANLVRTIITGTLTMISKLSILVKNVCEEVGINYQILRFVEGNHCILGKL